MKTAILAAILFLLAGNALAEPLSYMEKENPNELGYYVNSNCEIRTDAVDPYEIIDGVMIRARIKPDRTWGNKVIVGVSGPEITRNMIFLSLYYNCVRVGEQYAFWVDISFSFAVIVRGQQLNHIVMYERPTYSGTGFGDPDWLAELIRSYTEEAITDYLQANFDL